MNYPAHDMASYSNMPSYGGTTAGIGQWSASQTHMVPSALQTQPQYNPRMAMNSKKTGGMKSSMSTEFNYNFGSKMISEPQNNIFGLGYPTENDSDSDGDNNHFFNNFDNQGKFFLNFQYFEVF